MTIYIDADTTKTTWRHIAEAGGYPTYLGRARRGDVVIRWGCNYRRYTYPEGVRILNPNIILNKIEQGNLFIENNVSIPKIFTTKLSWDRAGNPQLVHKPAIGQMGTGMRLSDRFARGPNVLNQLYIPKQREFRAMMVGNIMAFFMEKLPPANGDFRWNEHRGAEWITVGEERGLRTRVKALGYAGLKAVGYDFGACDIIQAQDGTLYLLEVNSRPEFEERNAARFARAIAMYLQQENT